MQSCGRACVHILVIEFLTGGTHMERYHKKRTSMERGQIITMIVCLSFLIGIMSGAIAANIAGQSGKGSVALSLQTYFAEGTAASFGHVFWKNLKYILLIWVGGWLSMGVFLASCVCLFRALSIGFTAAMLMAGYGGKGVLLVCMGILPQYILLIPACVGMTIAAISYLFAWEDHSIRARYRKSEQRKKRLEYTILLAGGIVLTVLASAWEFGIAPRVLVHFGTMGAI